MTKQPEPDVAAPIIDDFYVDAETVVEGTPSLIKANVIQTGASSIHKVWLQWDLDVDGNGPELPEAQPDIEMTKNGPLYEVLFDEDLELVKGNRVHYWIYAENTDYGFTYSTTSAPVKNFDVDDHIVRYSDLILTEIDGNQKFVEIYNTGKNTTLDGSTAGIPLSGVKLYVNDTLVWDDPTSEKVIEIGQYGLFEFKHATNHPTSIAVVDAEISNDTILKVALGSQLNTLDVFIRGQNPLPLEWGGTDGVVKDTGHSYTRKSPEEKEWHYAQATLGAANNQTKTDDILNPRYLTAMPTNPPEINSVQRTPAGEVPENEEVTISANISTNPNLPDADLDTENLWILWKVKGVPQEETPPNKYPGNPPALPGRL